LGVGSIRSRIHAKFRFLVFLDKKEIGALKGWSGVQELDGF
tara:strand:- start:333 stop:455 length:123 start_codon:yes stop_codon:yes gene_type:complete